MSQRAGVLGAAFCLQHVPDLVRYGSKPRREHDRMTEVLGALRTYDEALSYPPHQVFIGNLRPEELWKHPRPWWSANGAGARAGRSGEIMPEREYYELLAELDQFDLVRLGAEPNEAAGEIPLFEGKRIAGAFAPAHEEDESLQATVLLENLACKASGVHALRFLLERTGTDPESIEYAVGCGEEAVGDRYQRGGGALAKAIAEACGLVRASGSDIKAFCAAPVHALIVAGALVESGTYERVAVVAGGSLAKLGMKFQGALEHGVPVLEDVLAGMAVLVGPAGDSAPVLRLDAVGRHQIGSGSSQQALLTDIVVRPLEKLGRRITDVERYSTELHNPEITEPAGAGDVPERNYRMLAGLAVMRGELDKAQIPRFSREHGLPGFAPTQGHIASAVPWLPHALERLASGEIHSTMLMAKGSLFLGRMTQLWDGSSITLEVCDDMALEATPETFPDLVADGNVLVDFWGPRCQPCLAMMPAVEALAETYGGRLTLVKVNAPENRQVCRDLRVLGLPTYVLYRDGAEVERLTGDPSRADIETAVKKLVEGGE